MRQKLAPKSDIRVDSNVIEFPQGRSVKTPAEPLAVSGNVNKNELTSIKALTSYVAHNKNVPEDVVRAYLLTEFKAPDVTNLRRADYERAIRFLVDLQVDLLLLN